MPTLPTKADLVTIVGTNNVNQWADVDNLQNQTTIDNRVTWAIQQGYNYVVGRIALRFDITTFVSLPAIVYQLIAQRACIELYQSPRGLVDGDPAVAQLNSISLLVESRIDQILAGILRVTDAPVQPEQVPTVENAGRLPWNRIHAGQQWTGDPCVIDCGNFIYSGP